MRDADGVTREEPSCGVREPRRPPAVGDEDRRLRPAGGGHGAARGSVVLRELRQHRAAPDGGGVHGGREAVSRAGAAQGDEYRVGRRARKQKLQPAHLVSPAGRGRAILPLEGELGHADGAGEPRSRLERRGPVTQATRRQRRTYLFNQLCRIRHPKPRSRGRRCALPPTTSVTPRAPPASAWAIRWAAPPSRRTLNSTRRSPRRSTKSPPAWTRSASKSELHPHTRSAGRSDRGALAGAPRRRRYRGGELSPLSRPDLPDSAVEPVSNRDHRPPGGGGPLARRPAARRCAGREDLPRRGLRPADSRP